MSLTEEPIDPLMSVPKVAALFDVKPETIRSWISSGKLPAVKINGYWRVRRSDVVALGNSKYAS